jgi:streptogramin lyase
MRYARISPAVLFLSSLLVIAPAAAASSPQVVTKLVTGQNPCGVVAGFGSLWVANDGSGTLTRIDPKRNRIARRIRVAKGVCPVAIAGGAVWVASYRTDTVYRVSSRSGRILSRKRVSHWPAHFAVGAGSVWLSNYEHGLILRFNARNGRMTAAYKVGGNPSGLAFVGGDLWVSFGRGTTLGRVELAGGRVSRFELGHRAPGFLTAIGGELWTTTSDGHALRFDPRTGRVLASFSIPGTPADVRKGADGAVWVAEKERDTLTRIDPSANRILEVTSAGNGAFSIAVSAGDTWITSYAGNDIWRFARNICIDVLDRPDGRAVCGCADGRSRRPDLARQEDLRRHAGAGLPPLDGVLEQGRRRSAAVRPTSACTRGRSRLRAA